MVTSDEVLLICRNVGGTGAFTITQRAHDQALAAGQSSADLRHALASAASCVREQDRWKVQGPSLDGTVVTMFVVLTGGVLVVT